jgi:YegS/Rv2252/BmrU family lipid kinase
MGAHEGKRIGLLVNPAAGRGRSRRRLAGIISFLEQKGVPFEVLCSESPGHLTELAASLQNRSGNRLFPVVCGGDGTFNEVINGLSSPLPAVGIVPAGTANDIAACLGIPASLEEACTNLFTGSPRRMDLVSSGSRLFAGIGGAGIDSEVTMRANRIRLPVPGHAVYTIATLTALASFRPYRFSVTSPEWNYRGEVMFVGVANTPSYGGGMRLSPASDMSDGEFEVCIVESMGRLELLRNFPRLFAGTHLGHPRVRVLRARKVRMESDRAVEFCADGEHHQALPVDLRILPSALTVVAPARRREGVKAA